MADVAAASAVEAEVRRSLAELAAARERAYYDEATDAAARDAYYEPITADAPPAELADALADLLDRTHDPHAPYKPAERVYPWVDLHPDGRLRSIYSGKAFEPEAFIRADAEIALRRTQHLHELARRESTLGPREFEDAFDALERELPFNCEHVVPQSWFAKREPMRGDLHHLFACESRCNAFRGNTPYTSFGNALERLMSDCGRSEEPGFEPVAGKGPVARATLYFLLRYPGAVSRELRERVAVLLDWHRTEAPDDYERHRNAAIAELQGNRNPLIDHPEWADRLEFMR